MNYIYFELQTSGATPLFSRILSLGYLIVSGDSNYENGYISDAKHFIPNSLSEEYTVLKDFVAVLKSVNAIVCFDVKSLKYLSDCFRQYFIRFDFADMEMFTPETETVKDLISQSGLQFDLPVYNGELKYFFSDYKNYYYFPLEDTAVHKSVASFADKSSRIKATPETAYIKKTGSFVPVPYQSDKKLFRKSHSSKEYFCLLCDADSLVYLHLLLTQYIR